MAPPSERPLSALPSPAARAAAFVAILVLRALGEWREIEHRERTRGA